MVKTFLFALALIAVLLLYHSPSILRAAGKFSKQPQLVVNPEASPEPSKRRIRSTNYVAITRDILSEHQVLLTAKVDRDYNHIEHLQRPLLGYTFESTIVLTYSVTYSVGFDLQRDKYHVTGDQDRITVSVQKPILVAPPGITVLRHNVPSSSLMISERSAVIDLQQRLPELTAERATQIVSDPAVIALAERGLMEFLADTFSRHPDAMSTPSITVTYL